jgi:hypothetical protein
MSEGAVFRIDEEALRQIVLKAYHAKRTSDDASDQDILEAVRAFLSGGVADFGRPTYRFEDSPESALETFAAALEATSAGLASALAAPLLSAIDEAATRASPVGSSAATELAPNPSVWLASLAGPIALRHSLDETVVSSALAATTLGLARLGTNIVRSRLAAV